MFGFKRIIFGALIISGILLPPNNIASEKNIINIPLVKNAITFDGIIGENEWLDATRLTGVIDQFEQKPSSRDVSFWLKRDQKNLYIAQRSNLKPTSPHPLWFKDGTEDNCVVIAINPKAQNSGDTPSHYVLRFNPDDARIGWEVCDQYKGVKLRWPHLAWQNNKKKKTPKKAAYGYEIVETDGIAKNSPDKVCIVNHIDRDNNVFSCEVVIPLKTMNIQSFPATKTWGLLLARDYPGVEQTAIVLSDDWRHGTANRLKGLGFYNLYRNTENYVSVSFDDKVGPQHIKVTETSKTEDNTLGTTAYYSGYHCSALPPFHRGERSMSVYNPITNRIFVRTRLGSIRQGIDAEYITLSIRKMGTELPLMNHTVKIASAPVIGLQMDPNHVGKNVGTVLTWTAPEAGTVSVNYKVCNRYKSKKLNSDATRLEKTLNKLAQDGGAATLLLVDKKNNKSHELIKRSRFKKYGEWLPICRGNISVDKGDQIQLYMDANAVACSHDVMSGKVSFKDKNGNKTCFYPAGEYTTKQGGTTGVWRYQYDSDATPNKDGCYYDLTFGKTLLYNECWRSYTKGRNGKNKLLAYLRKVTEHDEIPISFELPQLKPGIYEAKLGILDKHGNQLGLNRELFVRYDHDKDLPWLGNNIGKSNKVLPGWQPIKSTIMKDSLNLEVIGRKYEVDGSGLFRQITVKGDDILSAPMSVNIICNNQAVTLKAATKPFDIIAADDHVEFKGELNDDNWNIKIKGRLEYDGFCWFDLSLKPLGTQYVDSIKLHIPLKNKYAQQLHATGGIWMRSAVSTLELPQKDGILWTSAQSRGKGYNGRGLTIGNFKPYIWLGCHSGGLAFMADNDKGWVPDDTKKNSAELVKRHGDTTSLILNIVSRPYTFSEYRQIAFGIQATPIKEVDEGWRGRKLAFQVPFPGFSPKDNGWDWNGQMLKGVVSGHGSNPYPLNWQMNKQRREGKGFPVFGEFTPYQALNATLHPAEIEHPLVNGIHGANYYGYLSPELVSDREWGDLCISTTDIDYRLWHYRNWIKYCSLNGLYFDNNLPTLDALNRGYEIDLPDRPDYHGKIQPGYSLMNQRHFFKRLRTLLVESGANPCIWLHATDALVIPAFSFADFVMDGENAPYIGEKTPWTSEKYPIFPPHMRVINSADKWGLGVVYLPMWKGGFKKEDMKQKANRNMKGYYNLHDARCLYGNAWKGLDLKRKAEFMPYWQKDISAGIKCKNSNVKISAWCQDRKLYILAFNFGRESLKTCCINISPTKLGLKGDKWVISEQEPLNEKNREKLLRYRGNNLKYKNNNSSIDISVNILPRNYRFFKIEAR